MVLALHCVLSHSVSSFELRFSHRVNRVLQEKAKIRHAE